MQVCSVNCIYGKYSKISNAFCLLFANKMFVIRAGSLKLLCLNSTGSALFVYMPFFGRQTVFKISEHLP